MQNVFIYSLLALSVFAIAPKASACQQCSSISYQELCVIKLTKAGYDNSDSFGEICSGINSADALKCADGLIRNGYSDLSQDIMNGCSWATDCGVTALNSLFNNGYQSITGDLIAAVGNTHSRWQAQCMAKAFNEGYSNITPDNIVELCP